MIDTLVIQATDANGLIAFGTFFIPVAAQPQCATPVLSPAGGSGLTPPQTISITDSTPSSAIYYTSDGSTPVVISGVPQGTTLLYSAPFSISIDTVINAIATAVGYLQSPVATAVYNLTLTPLWP